MTVDVTVLYFSGCPNWRTAVERVHLAAGRAGVPVRVSTRLVETQQEAERIGFTGSPTLWLDGVDPFAREGSVPALACRVYATPEGLRGSPTVAQLSDVLTRNARRCS
jgi:hypothetical protein